MSISDVLLINSIDVIKIPQRIKGKDKIIDMEHRCQKRD